MARYKKTNRITRERTTERAVTVGEFLWSPEVDFGAYVRDEPEHDEDPDPEPVDAVRVDLNFRYYI